MIEVDFYVQPDGDLIGFCSKGHANYAVSGEDIVCAALSSAVYMTVNTITDILKISPDDLYVEDGIMHFRISSKDAVACRVILMGLKLHLIGLEEQYRKYMRVSYLEV